VTGVSAAARARSCARCSTGTCGPWSHTRRRSGGGRRGQGRGRAGRGRGAARLRRDRRLGADPARPRGRPDADRQDPAPASDVRRLLGRGAAAFRRDARGKDARWGRGASPSTSPAGAASPARVRGAPHRDELPAGRHGPLRELPRCALLRGDARGALARSLYRRVLAMSVDEAAGFFEAHAPVRDALRLLQEVGLGYLTLGQRSPSLSAARPSASNWSPSWRRPPARCSTCWTSPPSGLHMADVEKLIRVLHRLVDAGNTVVVIEHNLDVIAEADWLIDLGPEGGAKGGRVVAAGTPAQVAKKSRRSTPPPSWHPSSGSARGADAVAVRALGSCRRAPPWTCHSQHHRSINQCLDGSWSRSPRDRIASRKSLEDHSTRARFAVRRRGPRSASPLRTIHQQ